MADINLGVGGANSATGGYEIANSLKFEADNTENLTRTPSSASNQKTWTWSGWVKYTEPDLSLQTLWAGGTGSGDGSINFRVDAGTITVNTASTALRASTAKFRDSSAWYHFVLVMDTTQSTANDRVKVYVNGSQITDFSTTNNPSLNADMGVNSAQLHALGRRSNSADRYFSGYMAEVNFVDGTSLAPTAFGEFDEDSGIWKPKAYTGSYGTNGFYLDFESSGSLGADGSGNGNNFTLNNITSADQATDTPTNNFCTLNPNVNFKYTTNGITEGATTFGDNTGGGVGGAFGTMAVTKGKWYWEVKLTQQNSHYIGISAVDDGDNVTSSSDPHQINSSFRFNISGARIEYIDNGTNTNGSLDAFGDFHTVGDIIGIALNMDDNQISIYGNGALQTGVANSSLFDASNKMVVPLHATINDECQYNFGGYSAWTPSSPETDENGYGTFEYAPPSGYYALCTKNLAEYG